MTSSKPKQPRLVRTELVRLQQEAASNHRQILGAVGILIRMAYKFGSKKDYELLQEIQKVYPNIVWQRFKSETAGMVRVRPRQSSYSVEAVVIKKRSKQV